MLVKYPYGEFEMPESKTTTGKICFISSKLTLTNCDLDSDIHKGFTIGKGKKLYWYLIWHPSGNVTVYPADGKMYGRWISGDTEITVHFK
jgi:hypothetical protein